jgi:hypothetical protein
LKERFIAETSFPAGEGWDCSIEDKIIPLPPNFPCGNDEELREEVMCSLVFCFLHHRVER